ncbi:Oligopeptidase A [Enhygromyxa salina]|uniref:oligopeptidase A n=1 Tax=Enhygromyxa salina TaxID=215803 RepID=A0A0C2CXN3_9BACT|nr:M3 family metallopeptidase [Enhygromyxa salina]KIG12587.1 Oligopeptidase A [Enhygromyxa salina]
MTLAANPLVHERFSIAFDQIDAAQVEPAIAHLLDQAEAELQAIVALPDGEPRTTANTLHAFEELGRGLEWAMGVVGHLESVATTPELRAAYEAVQPKVSLFSSRVYQDPGLYAALRAFAATPAAAKLDATHARLLTKLLDTFRRNGAELDLDDKQRLAELEVELAKITTKFSQNVLDATNDYELVITNEALLAGLPDSARAAAKASADKKGVAGWRFTLHAPSMIPLLTYLDDAEIRRQVWMAYATRASSGERDNRELIAQILKLRETKAKLLGYESFADLILEDRMAKRGETARAFVDDLRDRSEAFFAAEVAELVEFRARELGEQAAANGPDTSDNGLAGWDVGYWSEKSRRARYDFDEEQLRPYFALEAVLEGMFELVNRLYGISVEVIHDLPKWHADVRTYRVRDGARELGCFYADLHPREDKRGGAWMNSLITGLPSAGRPHLGLICANLTEPLGDEPALLTHREVETVFHEFGHLLHHLLSEVEVRSLAGTNVAWDFVELPSQIMENWCWERASLDLFARHYKTGARIPDELFNKMLRARNFMSATAMMRQLGFASLDLALHLDYAPQLLAPDQQAPPLLEFCNAQMQRFSVAPLPANYAMICGFGHLFSSSVAYAAGYYSYKWAEVLDADAFSQFKQGGVFSREVGQRFRERVLARGDSRDPAELYREFRGQDPDLDPLLVRSGLVQRGAA